MDEGKKKKKLKKKRQRSDEWEKGERELWMIYQCGDVTCFRQLLSHNHDLCTSSSHGPLMQSKTRCDSNGRKAIMWVSAIKSFTNDDLEELKVIELGFVKLLLNMGQITS